ncbi:unnamed protein product [Prorocentrum cordatum]|uniref:ATP-dependent helicase C-terminal domain-containing protein n=1 Tax=Prorocentrum cordatum TaxID=2364126 RepID=A0ABN9WT02_9DINO|nr:unnamed protein product [Polarella glacialis]
MFCKARGSGILACPRAPQRRLTASSSPAALSPLQPGSPRSSAPPSRAAHWRAHQCRRGTSSSPSQLGLVFVGRASSGRELRCVRESMTHRAFAQALGQTLVELISAIPGGVLVFFRPSRAMLDAVNRFWSDAPAGAGRSVWQALQDSKGHLVIEGSGADARRALDDHQRAVERDGSCVFFGVYRGRASEGISLSDDSVRGVVCVGIPLAPLRPEVRLRRDYRNALAQAAPAPGAPRGPAQARLSGDDWYQLQAHRAVNQALGRVIRHREDYGVCALVDWRWTARGSLRAVRYLPLWLRQLVGIHDGVRGENADFALEHVVRQVRGHFANHLHRSSQGYAAGADAPGVLSGEDASRQVRPRRH